MLESQRKTYQLMLEQLHKIESKYGSINNAPDDDPNLIKLEQLRPKSNYQTLIDEQDEIMKLTDKGYPASDVAQKLGLRRRTVSDFFKRHKIQPRPAFIFKIISPDKKVFYAQSLGHFLQVSFHRSCIYSVKQSTVYLKRRNFQINEGYFIWAEVKKNEYFVTNNMDFPVAKKNDDSWAKVNV
ncbi:helix-turn-helix domain-containing protein [Lactobacillus amylovorus]|uniref:Helix-turn-helix domain-containing protein n=1 Tax=Lactobacillus amylovorus TaxID=1604 RepID=A0A9X4AB16_LACAM|nr:helix-turn-helix domain-containing protein [Lactobacillus amylovorus]MDB6258026.1 helix-turn-helix domain-containing protein [Lactobacillus amylovorus]